MRLDFVDNVRMEEGMAALPEACADLVVCDPPYYRVKGESDKAWADWEAYMRDAERWQDAVARVIKPTGTLLWWGFHKTIARMQVMLEKDFRILNNCVVHKAASIQSSLASSDVQRSFFCNEERLLVMEPNGGERAAGNPAVLARNRHRHAEGMCLRRVMAPIADYLEAERAAAGLSGGQINAALGTNMASHWFTRGSQWEMPTERWYLRLRELFNSPEALPREYDDLRREYDGLRREYDDLRRPFDMRGRRLSDIIEAKCQPPRHGHPTEKDPSVTRMLIETTTRPGMLVVAPFCGSGTECAEAKALGRHYIGFETNKTYCEAARERIAATNPRLDI